MFARENIDVQNGSSFQRLIKFGQNLLSKHLKVDTQLADSD